MLRASERGEFVHHHRAGKSSHANLNRRSLEIQDFHRHPGGIQQLPGGMDGSVKVPARGAAGSGIKCPHQGPPSDIGCEKTISIRIMKLIITKHIIYI